MAAKEKILKDDGVLQVVEISVKTDDGDITTTYTRPTTVKGAVEWLTTRLKPAEALEVIGALNYGLNLQARSEVKAKLVPPVIKVGKLSVDAREHPAAACVLAYNRGMEIFEAMGSETDPHYTSTRNYLVRQGLAVEKDGRLAIVKNGSKVAEKK